MLGKTEGRGRWGQQRMRWLDDITDSMDMSLSKFQAPTPVSNCMDTNCAELVMDTKAWHAAGHGVTKSRT